MPSISGQTILVIGGSSGIGFAVAKAALSGGARVHIASSNEIKVQNAVQRLKSFSSEAPISGHTIDLTASDPEFHLRKLLTEITEVNGGPIDHIVNTAAKVDDLRTLDKIDVAYLGKLSQMPLFVPILIGKLAPEFLKKSTTSSLIFTGGQVSERPVAPFTIFASYATALWGVVRGLAVSLPPIRVNSVSPGSTETEMWGPQKDFYREHAAKTTLTGKAGQPEEVAEAYIYLMKNSNATGSCVVSDGGAVYKA